MHGHFQLLDWVVLCVYFALMLGVGCLAGRKSKTAEGFTAASGSLPGWLCGLSIFATFLSSISFLAIPGDSFATNWNALAFSLSLPLATVIAVFYFLPYYRRGGEISAYALLERRFGLWARIYASVCYLLTQLARMGAVMFLMALPMQLIFGWDLRLLIILTGVATTLYSFVGGIVAVIWTDAIQAVVLLAGALLTLVVIAVGLPDGPSAGVEMAAEQGKFSLGSMSLAEISEKTFWMVLIYGFFVNLQNFGIDQNYVQRYLASSSDQEARRSVWLGGMLYVPVSALFLLIGTGLAVWYATHPEDRAELVKLVNSEKGGRPSVVPNEKELGDRAYAYFIGKRLPPGITGLVIAAIFSAAMSTISTSLNSASTLVLNDYYLRFVNPNLSDAGSMRVLQVSTVIWGILGTSSALLLIDAKGVLDVWWSLAGVFSGGMLGLFLLGRMMPRANGKSALWGVAAGLVVIIWMTATKAYWWPETLAAIRSPFHTYWVIVGGTLAILLVGGIASLWQASPTSERWEDST